MRLNQRPRQEHATPRLDLFFSRHRLLSIGVALATLFATAAAGAAGILDARWTMPTTNEDGSVLINLASFNLYYGTSDTPCPGASFISVTAPTSAPAPNQTATATLTGLTSGGRYFAAVTAVTSSGSESPCSPVASAVARSDLSVTPSVTVDFGTVTIGAVMDQTFTVKNTSGGVVSGTVATSAPFSVVSGSSFTLVGVGATATVTVRFTPAVAAVATTNVTFTVNGTGVSRTVIGTGAVVDSPNTPCCETARGPGESVDACAIARYADYDYAQNSLSIGADLC